MKLKKKDIMILVICLVVIGGAVFIAFKLLGSSGSKGTIAQTTQGQVEKKDQTITGNIDSDTLANINKFKDYDEAKLDNIGRVNPFAPIN